MVRLSRLLEGKQKSGGRVCTIDQTSSSSGTYTVVATTLLLKHWWDLPRFLALARGVQGQLDHTPGLVAYQLKASFLKLRFFTLSVWESPEDIERFTGLGAHTRAVEAFPRIARPGSKFIRWTTNDPDSVGWEDALRRLGS